ncbi:SRPBCC domain-containing protein [Salinibacterium sp. M195]|uniref:ArsR/SmtB family transcription factor n=1 Tax=Salinibacterium sp. M195 TaxID=2583374 RepID=UPI001C62B2F5|nr:SRPBCC domain-containing protein [Salinibacterium sp. M195]QYH36241.1 helix-turn-helix domain-containing protein [Salinibacterium sp. M195]
MDLVFKALADDSRRELLDALRTRDGQSLSELAELVPEMTRFGVAAHLKVLESAELVTTIRVGRLKLHYLNPVPLHEVASRWLGTFSSSAAQVLIDLRNHLEDSDEREIMHESTELAPNVVYRIDIRADLNTVWKELTDTGVPRSWMWGSMIESTWTAGEGYAMSADGFALIVGTVLEIDPPRYLRMTFDPQWDDASAGEAAGELVYALETRENRSTRLTVTISGLGPASAQSAAEDTPEIYSGLKSYLETGESL